MFLYIQYAFCPNDNCDNNGTSDEKTNGLRLTFGVCSLLAIIGWIWSYVLVRFDTLDNLRRIASAKSSGVLDTEIQEGLMDDETRQASMKI